MLFINAAFKEEVIGIINAFDLKSQTTPFGSSLYLSDEICVMIQGKGRSQWAFKMAWAFGRFPHIKACLNIGIAGAPQSMGSIGEIRLVHSVTDENHSKAFFPDILWKHPFQEAPLTTFDRPVSELKKDDLTLVDMEGFEFIKIASLFLPPHRIALLKIISDHLTPESFHRDNVNRIINRALPEVLQWIQEWPGFKAEYNESLLSEDSFYQKVLELPFSQTQTQFLKSWLYGYTLRGKDLSELNRHLPSKPMKHKREVNQLFEKLKDVLKS